MMGRRRVLLLCTIMAVAVMAVGGISTFMLYRAAFREQEMRLIETAQSQARLIEAVARFDAAQSRNYPGGAVSATLSQIREAHESYIGFGKTGEFTLAKREGDSIVFLLSHRHYDMDLPKPVSFHSGIAQPMRRALSGRSGTVVGLDYRGETVLAAHEPVAVLGLGIVAKIDLVERPYAISARPLQISRPSLSRAMSAQTRWAFCSWQGNMVPRTRSGSPSAQIEWWML